jgi:restriction endonuclease S subunit
LQAIDQTQPKKVAPLGEFCQIITNGHTPKHHDFSTGEVPFLMAEQILDFRIHYDTDKFILREQHDGELKRTKLREGDLLVTIKGRIGNAGIVEDLPGAVNVNQDIARIRLREGVPPYYILAFMNSLVGKGLVQKYCTGQINPFLSLANLRLIPIPIYEDERMKAIAAEVEKTVRSARSAQEESRRLLELAKVMIEQSVLRDKTT